MVDSDKVKSFPGVPLPDRPRDSQPVPEVVAFIEGLLARAKAGDIQAIAVAYAAPGEVTGDGWSVGKGYSHQIMAAIADLFYRGCMRRHENSDLPERIG